MNSGTSNTAKGLTIAGFVLGIIALLISFIPCINVIAILLGIIGLIFSVIGLTNYNDVKHLAIAGLACSILAIIITLSYGSIFSKFNINKWSNKFSRRDIQRIDSLTILNDSSETDTLKTKDKSLDKLEDDLDKLNKKHSK